MLYEIAKCKTTSCEKKTKVLDFTLGFEVGGRIIKGQVDFLHGGWRPHARLQLPNI